ncbi:WYL domain-containing protein [Rhizomonospora bruguierae]|uniref:WYL domain-containing protein n=1 Tax=Rhizomonospora bruguierae TaxID=1581705 RepID=UPI001BCD9EE3|nr:WYL domain-containing protein [Micromonospora sp. NBRC 107566]
MPPSPFTRWLAGLDADRLARVLAHRPEALAPRPVGTLPELSARLQEHAAVSAALRTVPLPAVQLIEIIQALGGPAVELAAVATTAGRAPDDPDLAATLDLLADRALVWPDGGRLRMAGPLWGAFEYPLGLGGPVRQLLEAVPATQVRAVAAKLGVRTRGRVDALAAIAERLADAAFVRSLLDAAPPGARDLAERLAVHGPLLLAPAGVRSVPELAWCVEHGLIVYDGWQYAQLAGEAGRALRGPGWHAPFAGTEPEIPLRDADPGAVDLAGAASATAAVQQVTTLLDVCAQAPVALLKAGGVGSRELKRLGRAVGDDIPRVRLWLELAYAAGLLGTAEAKLLPTAAYDEWSAAPPAERLPPLLRAWLALPAAATTDRARFGGDAPALTRDQLGLTAYELRPHLLAAVARVPAGRGVAEPERLADALRWRLPLLITGEDDEFGEPAQPPLVVDAWHEAVLLGVVAHGALTILGRALLAEPPDPGEEPTGTRHRARGRTAPARAGLAEAAVALLPAAVGEALFQADLTAVVPGAPTAPLAALLDAAADRESRGGGSTWRFSSGSVRRALDAGRHPDELLADLRAAAPGRPLPQPLEYLIADVARQHGRIRVRAVGCVLRAQDPALLAELVGARALAGLNLAALAPTVLASARPPAETLAALRAAGYPPAGEGADGAPLIERAPVRRAKPARRTAPLPRHASQLRRAAYPPPGGGGPEAARRLAEELLSAPPEHLSAARRPTEDTLEIGATVIDLTPRFAAALAAAAKREDEPFPIAEAVDLHAGHLPRAQRRLLATAIEQGTPIKIEYTDSGGRPSARVIEPLELTGVLLTAWCHLREDERNFALDRIDAVQPA